MNKTKKKVDASSVFLSSGVSKSVEPALYYGFMAIKTPSLSPEDIKQAKKISEGEFVTDEQTHEDGLWIKLPEKVALLRTYVEKNMGALPQPVMLVYERHIPKSKDSYFGLDIIGAPTSIAEALLIKATCAMLSETEENNLRVEINSIGDKDSVQRFTKEFSAFYKKNINTLPASCRQSMKKDLFYILGCQHDACKNLATECPKSVNFLSERSREHFREVIEYLEAADMPYVINNLIVANRDYCTETSFEIKDEKTGKTLAVGGRYDGLAKKLGVKKDLSAVGISVLVKKAPKSAKLAVKTVQGIMKPQVSFIQLGFEAKLKSLCVIEALRQARVPVSHSLAKDKIAGQVALAEKADAKILVIVGKKEALENSVIVRDKATRSQDTVSIPELPVYLKKVKI